MTDKIIDLNKHFLKMKKEKNQHTYTDENGEVWLEYAYSFTHRGKQYGYGIWARDLDEAQEMLNNMGKGKIEGEIHGIYNEQDI